MAIQAGVPVIVASASMDQDSFYHIHFSDPIPMQTDEDAETEIRINGEAILKVIEARIRKNPEQWLMYYPAWPDVKVSFE
jgi:lauroyl/myristoyl acyltransferase